jgi:hypothetical protein
MLGRPGSVARPVATEERPVARPGQVDALERRLRELQQTCADLQRRLDAAGL